MSSPPLNKLASLCLRYSKQIAILAAIVGIASVVVALRLGIDVGQKGRQAHVVSIRPPTGQPPETYLPLAETIAQGYRNSGRVQMVAVRALDVVVTPKRPVEDFDFSNQLLAEGAVIETRALNGFRGSGALPTIAYAGGYSRAMAEAERVRRDAVVFTLVPLVGVLVLFPIAFRRASIVGYALVAIVLSLAMTFALAALTNTAISAANVAFPALVTGIGSGLLAMFYGRYREQHRVAAATTAHSLMTAMQTTLPSVFIAGIVAAGALYVVRMPLAATGVLFFLLVVAVVVPALIGLSERKPSR